MLNNERMSLKQVNLNLDILPSRYKRKRMSFKQITIALGVLAGVLLLVLLYQVALDMMGQTDSMQAEIDTLNSRVQLRSMSISTQSDMDMFTAEYDAINAKRDTVYNDVMSITGAANEVGVVIDNIIHDGKAAIINCPSGGYTTYSDYRNTFESYYQALVQTEQFITVERPPTDWMPSASLVRIEVSH
ncbi:hypothetical protein ACFLVR_04425 [Chloroflexota bacterium]